MIRDNMTDSMLKRSRIVEQELVKRTCKILLYNNFTQLDALAFQRALDIAIHILKKYASDRDRVILQSLYKEFTCVTCWYNPRFLRGKIWTRYTYLAKRQQK